MRVRVGAGGTLCCCVCKNSTHCCRSNEGAGASFPENTVLKQFRRTII
jgi:hypothetical protein